MRQWSKTVLGVTAVIVGVSGKAAAQTFTGEQAWRMERKIICGTLADAVPRYGIFEGRLYARIPGRKDTLLLRVLGVNTRQCGTVEDPSRGRGFRSVSREVMLYLDPETGAVLDRWTNPVTGETLEVAHVANDPVNMRRPRFAVHADGAPLTLELYRYGDVLVSAEEVPLYYPNPLGGPYQAYVGGHYHAMEIFDSFYDARELLEASAVSMSRLSWTRIGPWLPWMKMGSQPGMIIINATGFSTFDPALIPEPLLGVLKIRYPSYLTPPPTTDQRPNETSWTVFRDRLERSADR